MGKAATVLLVALLSMLRLFGFFSDSRLSDERIHAISGEPSVVRASTPAHELTVVSWNIERGLQFDVIARALRAMRPDVVLLQEVDRGCKRTGGADIGRELARALDLNWVFAGEFQEIGEASGNDPAITGQAILSRYPIGDAAAIVFDAQASMRWKISPVQPRRGGRLALRARTAGVTFYNLHLESLGHDRLRASQLGQIVDHAQQSAANGPLVVAGDFNNSVAFQTFMFDGVRRAGLADLLGADAARQTSVNHRHPIDWMFGRGLRAAGGHVERVRASDHYPLVATIAVP